MKFLLGTAAYNSHIQNIALALYEAGALGAFFTGGVDNYRHCFTRQLRSVIASHAPALDKQLARRRIQTIPDELIYSSWLWEGGRTLSSRLRMNPLIQDWFWERGEKRLDLRCASAIQNRDIDAFFGVEHGCLETLHAGRTSGKRTVVAFLSPHHSTRKKWVDAEYEKFPELLTPATRRLLELGQQRDARRDEEAGMADVIHTASAFTAQSLIQAGVRSEKIVVVPLGSPPAIAMSDLDHAAPSVPRFVFAGGVSVHKGAHYLLRAWQLLNPRQAELHFYGMPLLPERVLGNLPSRVYLHGSVSHSELFRGYESASMLVFPTLCDGFGMVVMEAMAHGLPVITTPNAGASSFIQEGKTGFVVPPCNAEALAERLDWCIRHSSELTAMRVHALATAQSWTWAEFRASLREQLGSKLGIVL